MYVCIYIILKIQSLVSRVPEMVLVSARAHTVTSLSLASLNLQGTSITRQRLMDPKNP